MKFTRTAGVLLLVFVLTSTVPVHSLVCDCYRIILPTAVKFPVGECGTSYNCTTSVGMCFVELFVNDKGQRTYQYSCLNERDDFNHINLACNNPPTERKVDVCCNDSNNCNGKLRPEYLLPTSSSTTSLLFAPSSPSPPPPPPSNRSVVLIGITSGVTASLLILIIIFVVILALVVIRKQKLKRERNRRGPGGMRGAGPTGELEPLEMTMTSGSGSGLPFLIQRTVARSIKITEMIGNGRYGQVYLGYYQGEPVAVKKFFSRDEKSWVRETEIYNTLLLRHDNILGFFASDMVSNNGVTELWLITQYHQFGSLYDYLNREAVSSKVMLQMAISTCSGLAHLHTELFGTQAKPAIAHRDMKTKNVLVKNNRTCCIADFGLAVFKNQNEMNIPTNPKQGTKRYMAPEILNESINMKSFESFKQTDVYALGLVLWELCRRCTGKTGLPEDYEVPLQDMVPPDPSFEDMRRVVVMERRQPTIPPRWNTEELLREMTKVMKECWYYTSTARPTAVYLKKKLLKMSLELEKMDYSASQ